MTQESIEKLKKEFNVVLSYIPNSHFNKDVNTVYILNDNEFIITDGIIHISLNKFKKMDNESNLMRDCVQIQSYVQQAGYVIITDMENSCTDLYMNENIPESKYEEILTQKSKIEESFEMIKDRRQSIDDVLVGNTFQL